LHYAAGHWDFPKGKIEKGESSEETALRELEEETGISQASIQPGFKETVKYVFKWKGKYVMKYVVYFAGSTMRKRVKVSFEHKGFEWLSYEKTLKKITYRNTKNVLKKAEAWLNEE